MALLQMRRIFIYALKKDRKQILELLQLRSVVEVRNMIKEDSVFHKTDVSVAKTAFEKNINVTIEALGILKIYAPNKKSMLSALSGRKEVSTDIYEAFHEKYDPMVRIANRIISLSREMAEYKAEIIKYRIQAEMISPWIALDISLNFSGTEHTAGFIGTLPDEWTLEAIYEKLAAFTPVHVEIISALKDQTCVFVLCSRDKSGGVYEALRGIEFSYPSISFEEAPVKQLENLQNLISEAESAITAAEAEITSYADKREELLFLQDYDTIRAEKYEVLGNLLQSKNIFMLTGFIPEKDTNSLSEELSSKFDIAVEIMEPTKRDKIPVLYKNNSFSSPLEGTVNAFSPPGAGEVDPTMVMSLFYYMLFGIMLSDAGYGAIIATGCAFLLMKFKKTMENSMKKTLKMYLYCGIATVFWGVMFGSYFGDLFDIISIEFFGNTQVPVIPPLWFFPVAKPMLMLTFSMALGIVHLLTGLGMKAYQLAKKKDYKAILFDVVFWYVMLICGITMLLSMDMIKNIFGISISIPSIVVKVSGILAAASAVGIILTNGRESNNPFKRILKGLYALYGVSGYLSDILSYSRLLALGLATGVIGSVINKMAAMTPGLVFFIIVVIAGHILNLSINALGAYVHTNRLQYVEFFGKFYGGGGRLFNPFGVHTKYYKLKESVKNVE